MKLNITRQFLVAVIGIFLLAVVLTAGKLFFQPNVIKFHIPNHLYNQDTIFSCRDYLEKIGAIVTFDEKAQEITIQTGLDSYYLEIKTDSVQGIPIYVDNVYIGKTPVKKRLSAGKYVVVAKNSGHVSSIRYLTLKPEIASVKQIILPVDQKNYEGFLDEIILFGYKPIRVMDYYNHAPITKKTIVLRHDVDVSAEDALAMAKIEHLRGVKSTYYFRWCTADPEVLKEVRALGHEVGLHYETLADYSLQYHLKSAQDITSDVKQELRRRLKTEIVHFRQQYGEIYTIASHGAKENIRLGVTNYQAIMAGENPYDYNIIGTAYGPITQHFTYMSDSGGIWEPFPYPKLESNAGPFYILIHPIHWASGLSR
ncbi:MAG: PEGA domain-containing protein [Dehalobacter sp. 4CP]|uniref:PEGA domain-containing protein n=1 Tax=Dehalobacter sp. CP TaxID=2594474 RepID=UPI0013C86D40|nr:PEGA domain-containing protein [Dehalobacter sp. 4CP]